MLDSLQNLTSPLLGLLVISLASHQIGKFFARAKLPLITGFLAAGVLAGPYVLDLLTADAVRSLRFVDHVSLAVIALAAGKELQLKELRDRLKSISFITAALMVATFSLTGLVFYFMADWIPFMAEMPPASRLAVCLLGGSVLIARSPSSAIAIVTELRARGPMTRTLLGVAVIMDVLVIVVFAINSEFASVLLTESGFNLSSLALVAGELIVTVVSGYVFGRLLQLGLAVSRHPAVRGLFTLLAGYLVFSLSSWLRHWSGEVLPFEILLEPLLVCVVGAFVVTNFTAQREGFEEALLDVGPPVYVVFFTLTGASLAVDVLANTWAAALILFATRLLAITIGVFAGGVAAGEPEKFNRISWMAYVTQAGIALGLAKKAAVEFPELGAPFATVIIAVVVLNQIVGPPFLKWVIRRLGEAYRAPQRRRVENPHEAIIFGLEEQSLALARLLKHHDWKVRVASRKARGREREFDQTDVEIHPIGELDLQALEDLDTRSADAVIAMLSDEENLKICDLVARHVGTKNLIVRMSDRDTLPRFQNFGALVVYPPTALVGLLERCVRSPSHSTMLLETDGDQDVVEVEIRNPALHGTVLRDLDLPLDTRLVSIRRGERMLVSHGYTPVEVGDRLTLIGRQDSLKQLSEFLESSPGP